MTISVKLPDGRTIKVDTQDAKEAAKAARTYLARERGTKSGRALSGAGGAMATFNKSVPGFDELADAIGAAGKRVTGQEKTLGDAWSAQRAQSDAVVQDYAKARPNLSALSSGTGMAAQLIPAFLSGGATASPTLAKSAPGLLSRIGKSALVGGGIGYGTGVASEGNLDERLKRGNEGGVVGALTGGAVPLAGKAATSIVGSAPVKTAVRAVNRLSGGRVLNAETEAAKRLVEAMKADKMGTAEIKQALNQWMKTGASTPALLDLLPAGGKAQGLVRAASVKSGPAQAAVQTYRKGIATDLQDRVIDRTRKLVPEERSAQQLGEDLTATRSKLASEQYAEPYAQPVQPVEATQQALGGSAGRAALQRARSAAEARMDANQVAEIDALLRGENGPVSAATLDRIKIAMGERARKAVQSNANDMAGGLTQRTNMIDQSLENVPGLQEARGVYRNMTQQVEAIPEGGKILTQQPDEFIYNLEQRMAKAVEAGDITMEQAQGAIRNASQVGAARAIEGAVGAPTEGATGLLNKLSTNTNTGRNLGALFGEEEAGNYRQAVANEAQRLQNARYIDQSANSKTSGVLADEALVETPQIRLNPLQLVTDIINKVRKGATLTDAEREALVNLVTSEVNQPSAALQALRPVPPANLSRYDTAAIPLAITTQRQGGQ